MHIGDLEYKIVYKTSYIHDMTKKFTSAPADVYEQKIMNLLFLSLKCFIY